MIAYLYVSCQYIIMPKFMLITERHIGPQYITVIKGESDQIP